MVIKIKKERKPRALTDGILDIGNHVGGGVPQLRQLVEGLQGVDNELDVMDGQQLHNA